MIDTEPIFSVRPKTNNPIHDRTRIPAINAAYGSGWRHTARGSRCCLTGTHID